MSDWLTAAIKKIEDMPQQAKDVRQAAMDDLFTFARLINPQRVYGEIHKDVCKWLQSNNDQNQ